jgi:catechol 2,3-dioxygenase-like lactoylglutathione lyase family enzyme
VTVPIGWPCWIGVVAENLDAQRRFYRDVLGLAELAAGPDWVQFDFGAGMLELVQRSEEPQYEVARYQVGYVVSDIGTARADLISRGAQPVSEIEGGDSDSGRWCYFRDAEGNVFELKERRAGAAGARPEG